LQFIIRLGLAVHFVVQVFFSFEFRLQCGLLLLWYFEWFIYRYSFHSLPPLEATQLGLIVQNLRCLLLFLPVVKQDHYFDHPFFDLFQLIPSFLVNHSISTLPITFSHLNPHFFSLLHNTFKHWYVLLLVFNHFHSLLIDSFNTQILSSLYFPLSYLQFLLINTPFLNSFD